MTAENTVHKCECGVSNKIEIWVDIIFRCVTKYYLPFFPNHLNMMKRFNSPTVQRQETGWIWPMGHSLLTGGLRDEHVTLRGQSPAMRFNTWTLGGTVCFILSIPIPMAVLLSTWRNPPRVWEPQHRESEPSRASEGWRKKNRAPKTSCEPLLKWCLLVPWTDRFLFSLI